MTLLLWFLGFVIYVFIIFLLGSVLGFNSLERRNSDRRAFTRGHAAA